MKPARFFVVGAAALLLAACTESPGGGGVTNAGSGAAFTLDKFCNQAGAKPSLRHTYIMLDQRALTKSDTPETFASLNKGVRDVVLAFGDPARSAQAGNTDYRERISVYVLPADGGAAKQIFRGCLPAFSTAEIAEAQKTASPVADFFTGGQRQTLANEAELFRSRLVQAIVVAAKDAPGPATAETGPLADSKLIESLRGSGRLVNSDEGLPRVILLANLAKIDLKTADTAEKARKAGFDAVLTGGKTPLQLGRAELHVFLNDGPRSALARDYAQAFFLSQDANLISWAADAPPAMPPAPVRVRRFTGEAAYPGQQESVSIRIAEDRNGALINSWVVLRGTPDRSTPITGQANCPTPEECKLRSDDGGFGQIWSIAPGGTPEFGDDNPDNKMNEKPFAGLRSWEFTISTGKLTGRVFDASVNDVGGNPDIKLEARTSEGAAF